MTDTLEIWKSSRIAVFVQVSFITLFTMGLFGGGGFLLDRYLETSPILFIVGLVLSFPLAQVAIYRKVRALTKSKLNSAK